MTTKIGVLKYIASSDAKGIKLEEEPNNWYNPVDAAAKKTIKDSYKGQKVTITLTDKNKFSTMELFSEPEGEELKVTEEIVADEEQLGETEAGVPTGASHSVNPKEEKVSPAPLPKEEMVYNAEDSFMHCLNPFSISNPSKDYTVEAFEKMRLNEVKIEKKNKLSYASWAEVWKELKKMHPTSSYQVHENREGMPFFYNEQFGAFVKVSVTVMGLTHTVHLPVMNHFNKAEKGAALDVMLINKNIQRAFAKAIAMHGMGLYVYEGEDLPEDQVKQ